MAAAVKARLAPVAYENPKYGFASSVNIEGNSGGRIDPDALAWLEPISRDAAVADIKERFERDGVVLVKNVIPRETVLAMRRKYFEYVSSSGVLKIGSDPTDGIFGGAGPGVASHLGLNESECDFLVKSVSAHKEEWVHAFAQDGHIMDVVKRIKPQWKDPLLFKRQLLRSNIPNSEGTATKVHFDQIFLRAAPPTSLTAWVPIGDIAPESGGLIYLENSVPIAAEIEEQFTIQNAELSDEEGISAFNINMMDRGNLSRDAGQFLREKGGGRRWLIAEYEAGDVVFHHPLMIHASGVNRDPQCRIRLATDLRFADRAAPYDHRWADKYFEPCDGL